VLLRDFLHEFDGRAIGNFLDRFIPARLLFGAEIRRGENFLHAKNLHALFGGVFDEPQVFLDIGALDLFDGRVGRRGVRRLDESAFNCAWHIFNETNDE
jgi:hypothetical protein